MHQSLRQHKISQKKFGRYCDICKNFALNDSRWRAWQVNHEAQEEASNSKQFEAEKGALVK